MQLLKRLKNMEQYGINKSHKNKQMETLVFVD